MSKLMDFQISSRYSVRAVILDQDTVGFLALWFRPEIKFFALAY